MTRSRLPASAIRELAVAASADPRSVQRVLRGESVRGMADDRIRRVLAERAIVVARASTLGLTPTLATGTHEVPLLAVQNGVGSGVIKSEESCESGGSESMPRRINSVASVPAPTDSPAPGHGAMTPVLGATRVSPRTEAPEVGSGGRAMKS
jgi:hypothetical protein